MTCPNCGTQLPGNAGFCNNCGTRLTGNTPQSMHASPLYNQSAQTVEQAYNRTASAVQNFAWGDFFSFRRMIAPQIIRVIYILMAALITLSGIAAIFRGSSRYDYGMMPTGFLGGLLIIIVGNVAWRLWCEFIIVLFRINSSLSNIDDNTRPGH